MVIVVIDGIVRDLWRSSYWSYSVCLIKEYCKRSHRLSPCVNIARETLRFFFVEPFFKLFFAQT